MTEQAQAQETENKKPKNKSIKWLLITLGIIVGLLFIGSMVPDEEVEKIGQVNENITQQENSSTETKIYKIGDKVQLGDDIVTIYSVANYKESNEFLQPETGNKYIAIDVGIENGGNEPIDYNTLDFELQDNKDYTYSDAIASKEPALSSGTLQPGRKVRGFIVFEIPTINTAEDVIFTPSFWGTKQIIISVN